MWKCTLLILALLLSIASLPANAGNRRVVKLKVYLSVDSTNTDIGTKADRAILKAFKQRYPYIEVSTGTGIVLDADTGPLMAVAGGTSPDVIYVNMRKSDSYIRQGIIRPLDDFIATIPEDELRDRYVPAVKKVAYRRDPDGRKHWYMIPYDNLVMALYYRKDLFEAAGLDPDSPPRTWDELLKSARALTDPHKGTYGILLYRGANVSVMWYQFLASAGGSAMEEQPNGEWKLTYNSDAGVRSAYFLLQLMQQNYRKNGELIKSPSGTDVGLAQQLDPSHVGMTIAYLNDKMIASINPYVTGIAPLPGDGLGHDGSELNARMMGLYAGVTDPNVKDAAFKFMWFWDSTEARRIRTEVYVKNGYGAFVNPAYLRKFGFTEYLKYVPKGWEQTLNRALKYGNPEPYGENCDTVYAVMDQPIEQMLAENLGNAPKDEALARIKVLLDRSVEQGKEKLLGRVPGDVLRVRRAVALVVSLLTLVCFALAFRHLMRIFTPPKGEGEPRSSLRKYWLAYVLLLPAVASIALWQYIPLIRGSGIAFSDYRIMGGSQFTGLDNFANVIFDPFFWKALVNTLYYAGLWVVLGFVAPITLSLFLSEVPRFKIFFRVLFYLPAVISGVVVMFMWKSFYDSSAAGLLNKIVALFGIAPQAWLQDPRLAMLCVIIPTVWAGMGPGCLIYLAALKSVPEELYEAAEIDGSGTLRKIWNITLPMIKPLIIINFIGAFIGAFNSADFVLVMTGGGPNYATHVLGLEIFYNAFLYLKFGKAAALGWLVGLMMLGFTAYQMKKLSNMTFKAGGN